MAQALLLENPHETADEVFVKNDIEVVRNPGAFDGAKPTHTLQGVDYLGLCSKASVTREVLEVSPQLKAIGAFCIGTSQIDLEATTELGICVFNIPCSNTHSVVRLAVDEIIDLCWRIIVKDSRLHRDIWDKSADGVHEIRGRTFDVIGYGNIGAQFSVLTEAMGLNVIFHDVAERLVLSSATQMPTMGSVLREADVVSVHVDGQLVNANLFGVRELAMMRPGALFINLLCGLIVDIDALHGALVLGHLTDAIVDVFPEEPNRDGDPFTSPLTKLNSVALAPHTGDSTEEVQYDISRFVASKTADYESTGSTDMSVNLPNLQLGVSEGSHYRIALIHRNTPGVLMIVNNAFVQTGASIGTQILRTAG